MLLFDKDDLSTSGFLEWKGETEVYGKQTLGITHITEDISTGDTLGCFTEMHMEVTGMKK